MNRHSLRGLIEVVNGGSSRVQFLIKSINIRNSQSETKTSLFKKGNPNKKKGVLQGIKHRKFVDNSYMLHVRMKTN